MIPSDPSPARPATRQEELERMSLMEHLEELRKRIIWSVLAVTIAFFPCWAYYREIYRFLVAPLRRPIIADNLPKDFRLAYLSMTDPFILYFKMAALVAVFLASPFILYQLWAFISPGLYQRERKLAGPFLFFTSLFFLAGGAFGYYIAFPMGASFLLGIGRDLNPVITVDKYFSFLMTVILGLGLMFELPVLMMLLAFVGVITPRFLMRFWRHAVVVIFIIAAIITPTPDAVNLCIVALPACGLYFLGVGAAYLAVRIRKQRQADLAAE